VKRSVSALEFKQDGLKFVQRLAINSRANFGDNGPY
jgi:hypothetical protein